MSNFVLIIVDQLSMDGIAAYREHYDDPAYLAHWVDTPHLDRLVREGVSFLRNTSPSAVCCPARASLFTSRMPVEHGVTHNNVGINQNVPNMGQWLEANSAYNRYYCGKWHAGGKWNCPSENGPRKIPGFDTLPIGEHATGDGLDYRVAQTVSAFVRNYDESEPFLVVAGLLNPHDICFWAHDQYVKRQMRRAADHFGVEDKLPPAPPNTDYDFAEPDQSRVKANPPLFTPEEWRHYLYDYCRMVEKIDADVAKIMDAVRDRDDDTFVIFLSDHGDGLGRHGRVEKWHPYESSIRVPLVVWNPMRIREGKVDTTHLTSLLDVFPTVCDFAGVPLPPHARGESLRPLLEGEASGAWRDHAVIDYNLTGRLVVSERYKWVMKYVYSGDLEAPYVNKNTGGSESFQPGEAEALLKFGERMLFDLEVDAWETVNLHRRPEYEEIARWHEERLRKTEAAWIPGRHYDRN